MYKAFIVLAAVGLAACEHLGPRHETYDLINEEMTKAAAVPSRQSDAVAAALLPPLRIEIPQPAQPAEERFNLAFSNVPAQQFFMSLVSGTPYNMLVHPEVNGSISANLKDVTLFEALDAIREMYGYDYSVEGRRIVIKPLTMQTKVFHVNYLTGSRRGSSDTRVSSGSVGDVQPSNTASNYSGQQTTNGGGNVARGVDSAKISTTLVSDFWSELKASLDAIVDGEGRSVVISPQAGVVVVRAMPDELRNVAAYLKATQLSVDRQVILEAKIIEVQLNDGFQSGVNWAQFHNHLRSRGSAGMISPGAGLAPLTDPVTGIVSSGPTAVAAIPGSTLAAPATAAGGMFSLAFQTSNFAALISFLESQGSVHVLSSPRIATMNNQKAVLKVGTDEFFVTNVSATTTTGTSTTTTPSVTLQPFFSGVVLDVTPQIDDSGNVLLHVHPSVSQVSTVTKNINLGSLGGALNLPLASSDTSETDSIVRGRDGEIVAIGGLMRQATVSDRSQVPGAGNLPVAGHLFKNTNQSVQKRELVILLKPTIVKGSDTWSKDVLDSQQRVQRLDSRLAFPRER